jgi:uncharacterized protein YjiS (DUF1127 family)
MLRTYPNPIVECGRPSNATPQLLPGYHWPSSLSELAAMARLWLERSRSRRVLATLDDCYLRDIGLTRADVREEAAKPFWR